MFPSIAQPLPAADCDRLDPLVLAYVGDGVQTLYVRTALAEANAGSGAGKLHRQAIGLVSAQAQAEQAERVLPHLTDEEEAVYRRARNHKTHSSAKNATLGEYHKASGLEAVWGYLYLSGQTERLGRLLAIALEEK